MSTALRPVPHARFVRELRAWLDAQDPTAIEGLPAPFGPAFEWHRDGWRVRITPIPLGPEAKGRSDLRPLGVMSPEEDGRVTWMAMRDLLAEKASGYGQLDGPYVIALNAPDVWPDSRDAEWSVLGPFPFTDSWQREGFLLNGSNERSRVSAVVGTAVQPHTVARRTPTLYENPAALAPVPDEVRWPRVVVAGARPERVAGSDPADLFGLTTDWPGIPWP